MTSSHLTRPTGAVPPRAAAPIDDPLADLLAHAIAHETLPVRLSPRTTRVYWATTAVTLAFGAVGVPYSAGLGLTGLTIWFTILLLLGVTLTVLAVLTRGFRYATAAHSRALHIAGWTVTVTTVPTAIVAILAAVIFIAVCMAAAALIVGFLWALATGDT